MGLSLRLPVRPCPSAHAPQAWVLPFVQSAIFASQAVEADRLAAWCETNNLTCWGPPLLGANGTVSNATSHVPAHGGWNSAHFTATGLSSAGISTDVPHAHATAHQGGAHGGHWATHNNHTTVSATVDAYRGGGGAGDAGGALAHSRLDRRTRWAAFSTIISARVLVVSPEPNRFPPANG